MARILIVDDSPSQLEGLKRLVEKLGHQALTAVDGAAGVDAAKRDKPDLVLMDVVMPGMNGRELAERLLELKPTLNVLFTSGYTENVIVHHGILESSLNFIGKPYTMQALARKIREVLGPPIT